jgi:chitinase
MMGKEVIGYYASWQWYDRGQLAKPQNMDFTKVTRVNFAFFQSDIKGNLYGTDSWADPNVLFGPYDYNPPSDAEQYCSHDSPGVTNCATHFYEQGLISRAHTAGAEIWPSIGGWSLSTTFPTIAASSTSREQFANQCVSLIQDYNFDGIDIDWEYPGFEEHQGTPQDTQNFNLLLQEVRNKLDSLSMSTGKKYGLSAAVSCDPEQIAKYDVPFISNVLSEINVMTYDFHGSWDPTTGVNAPLYPQGWGPTDFDINSCVKNWQTAGAPISKLNMGMPFYGRSFATATGLNQNHTGADTSHWGADEGSPTYYNIDASLSQMNLVRDDATVTPYAYFSSGGMISYDDPQSICEKTGYLLDNSLHGMIIWELSGDLMADYSTPLLDAINSKLSNPSMVCGK